MTISPNVINTSLTIVDIHGPLHWGIRACFIQNMHIAIPYEVGRLWNRPLCPTPFQMVYPQVHCVVKHNHQNISPAIICIHYNIPHSINSTLARFSKVPYSHCHLWNYERELLQGKNFVYMSIWYKNTGENPVKQGYFYSVLKWWLTYHLSRLVSSSHKREHTDYLTQIEAEGEDLTMDTLTDSKCCIQATLTTTIGHQKAGGGSGSLKVGEALRMLSMVRSFQDIT